MCRSAWCFALFGLTLLLPACSDYASDPTDGAGGFLRDTHSFRLNPNQPVGDAPNVLRVEGKSATLDPLTPEEGDIWPGPVKPSPTLQDIEQEMQQEDRSAPMPSLPPAHPQPTPQGGASSEGASSSMSVAPLPGGRTSVTSGNGVRTYTDPKGGTGIVVPNGNGTSTLVGADGSITTVPDKK